MNLPVNQACLRNQQPILEVLSNVFTEKGNVLELACGTGQHAVHMASHLPYLTWQPTDTSDKLDGVNLWVNEANLDNLLPAKTLNVDELPWKSFKSLNPKYGYCANLIHFVSEESTKNVFKGMALLLQEGGLFAVYGPINNQGFTSEGNASLDAWLKADINPQAGIKEFADTCQWAHDQGLSLQENIQMPANNHIFIFKK